MPKRASPLTPPPGPAARTYGLLEERKRAEERKLRRLEGAIEVTIRSLDTLAFLLISGIVFTALALLLEPGLLGIGLNLAALSAGGLAAGLVLFIFLDARTVRRRERARLVEGELASMGRGPRSSR